MITLSIRPAPLFARLAIAGALVLGLAGGVASGASAAPGPSDSGRPDLVTGGSTTAAPSPTVPDLPLSPVPPNPDPPCQDQPGIAAFKCPPRPDPCRGATSGSALARRCPPRPCDPQRGPDRPERCRPDPCGKRLHKLPERCRPDPCAPKENDRRLVSLTPDRQDCPPPPRCDDPDRCDRPVPGKPDFTG